MPKDTNDKDFIFAEINAAAPDKVQLMRTIKAEHGFYGSINLESDDLRKFKENFDNKVLRIDIAVDYSHMAYLEAAGWITDVELQNNDTELWLTVEWTEEAKAKIKDKQYRYLSADFSMKYIDNESGQYFGQVLKGAGLTNRPFIRGMEAILSELDGVELSTEQIEQVRKIVSAAGKPKEKENTMPQLDDVIKDAAQLSDEEKAKLADSLGIKAAAPAESPKTDKQLADANAQLKAEQDKSKKLEEENAKMQKERKFDKMLAEGSVVEAQRESYLSDDIDAFAAAKEDVNLDGKGTEGGKAKDLPKTAEEAHMKLSEIADEIVKKEGIEFSEAYSKAASENEALFKLADSGEMEAA